ncbi:MAG: hypothetical protein QM644_21685 [Mobilitalea sp.]
MRWQDVEDRVRKIAELHWNAPCRPDTVHGIKCDGIIRVSADEMIAIEITKRDDLGKLRDDIAKLNSIRNANFQSQIFTRCYFVTEQDPSSLKATGLSQNVTVLSVAEFAETFLGGPQYAFLRSEREFGSAVDPETGEPDKALYTPIKYVPLEGTRSFGVEDISNGIISGESIVLIGEFGSGKSRCIKEVFGIISKKSPLLPILAINLRENWGLASYDLIVRHHLGGLGLSKFADDVVKLVGAGHVKLLLDGFDEIGSQSWTGEATRLREIRKKSLVGIRDLIQRCSKAGVLIAGREHYFSSDEEMFDCLNLASNTLVLRCPDEFSEEEIGDYIRSNTKLSDVPDWMPRKPLICQLFTRLDDTELKGVVEEAHGEVSFFEHFFDAICARETRIHPSIDKPTLRGVLLNLSARAREKSGLEELSPNEINEAFFEVSGHTPLDESSIILQRLPYLGRVGSGSPNRIFIDDYAKSGLRGIYLLEALFAGDKSLQKKRWQKPLGDFGAKIIATKVSNWGDARKYARLCDSHGNRQVVADIVCAELAKGSDLIDFSGLEINSSFIQSLDLSGKKVISLVIKDSYVNYVDLEDSELAACSFLSVSFERVSGVAARAALPDCFDKTCIAENFIDLENSSRISKLPLSDRHKTLLVIIQKLFFQRGRGRKEDALLRGSSSFWVKSAADEILQYMKKHGIVIEAPGRNGLLYVPQLSHRSRMKKIKEGMSTSQDELWKAMSK